MTSKYNPWDALDPKELTQIEFLDSEKERWSTILDEPMGLFQNPHKYGPLTFSGYYQARTDWNLRGHTAWPQEPVAIAHLMKTIGVSPSDAAVVAINHRNFVTHDDHRGFARLLTIHLVLLKLLDVTPTHVELLDAMRNLDWGDGIEYEDYVNTFDAMRGYLVTPEEETTFLNKWLPSTTPYINIYGYDESMGLALAAKFTRAEPSSLIKWCKQHNEAAGLGYLVLQERASLTDWLLTVAQPTAKDRIRGQGNSVTESQDALREEQLETLKTLMERLPATKMQEQGRAFYENHPEALERLLAYIGGDPFRDNLDDDVLLWTFLLHKAGALPIEHKFFTHYFAQAVKHQEITLSELKSGGLREATMVREKLYHKMHHTCGPIAKSMGYDFKRFFVQDMLLRVGTGEINYYVGRMVQTSWLKDGPIMDVINARMHAGMTNAEALILPMYGFMTQKDKIEAGKTLLKLCHEKKLRVGEAIISLMHQDPAYFKDFESPHRNTALLMHRLAQQDPTTLLASMEGLDIKDTDPLYLEMAQSWVAQHMGEIHIRAEVDLPQDLSNDALGL